MEEETINMTMEEDNNQYNPIEIKDNRIYNNYIMSIENEEAKDDKESKRNRGKSGGGYERERRNEKGNTNKRPNH
ncbi:hypothetical protein ENUP19_0032G0002 [Entamoeba nuttalli]|uniref:Uncharacterized protein n=1 Tax=Entamoeba nuttalli TaxID=412467 RepID=A0ABQ0D986_9EUKA